MKIIRWDHYDYDAKDNKQKEYRELDDPNPQETYMNLCDEIRRHGYKFDGPYHQNGKMGTPVVEGDLYMLFSYRSWGGVMADAWSSVDKVGYNYMDFYMMDNYSDEFKTPEYDLPGFVKPERPILTSPDTHLEELTFSISTSIIKKNCTEIVALLEATHVLNGHDIELIETGINECVNKIKSINEQVATIKKAREEFYIENPQYDPKTIVTLTSKDGKDKVRVFGYKSKGETYESIFEKYNNTKCTSNEMAAVFPDWNHWEQTCEIPTSKPGYSLA